MKQIHKCHIMQSKESCNRVILKNFKNEPSLIFSTPMMYLHLNYYGAL